MNARCLYERLQHAEMCTRKVATALSGGVGVPAKQQRMDLRPFTSRRQGTHFEHIHRVVYLRSAF